MNQFSKKAAAAVLTAGIAACVCFPLTACGEENLPYEKVGYPQDFLTVQDGKVMNTYQEEIYLRGVNAGGLFVTEHWMTGFLYNTKPSNDYRSLTQTFLERFGEEKTKKLWNEYRANWWSKEDFKNCADMGMNVIRLPFTYMTVDFAAVTSYEHAGENYDFSALDDFVNTAAKYGMYTILDLHGAYGSQNGKDHSGENKENVDFYSNDEMKGLTVNLWKALAAHYKDNAAVAGYDILNEPGERAGSTSERHWNFYDQVYDAIRGEEDEHIIIMESCWDGKNLPQPSKYGWENCMYSFHHYADDKLSAEQHLSSWKNKLSEVEGQNFGVPLQMGEFTCYESAQKWEETLPLLNEHNWHWTSWTYKIWPKQELGMTAWGIVNVTATDENRLDAANDSYDELMEKFKVLRTGSDTVEEYTFYTRTEDGEKEPYKTLADIFYENCKQD
ncbi:MAG: cellulase family glycosylhydrolase [Clostridia bacterium]|nr:cellulase family glycosylhydrolase [Clostridia bacterium]